MKGLFIPEITVEMFRNGCLESIETLMTEGEVYDIEYDPKSAEPRKKGKWIFIHPLQADDEGAYICSNCHRGDWDIKPTDKYCKFCGMAMDIYATLLP